MEIDAQPPSDIQNQSKRVRAFDNAMESYVNSIFGSDFFTNCLKGSLKPLYKTNKEEFDKKLSDTEKELNTKMVAFIEKEIEELHIRENLRKLDALEDDCDKENISKLSAPGEFVESALYQVKCQYLEKHQGNVDKEFEELKSELTSKINMYKTKKETIEQKLKNNIERNDELLEKYEEQNNIMNELLQDHTSSEMVME